MRIPIIILLLLTGPWVSVRLFTPDDLARADLFGLVGLILAFTFFGIGHFAKTDQMVDMLPTRIPARKPIVLLTGLLEFGLALGLIFPATRIVTGWACIAVLVGFFPVNVYASIQRRGGGGHEWGPIYLLIRGPLQLTLIVWCFAFTQ